MDSTSDLSTPLTSQNTHYPCVFNCYDKEHWSTGCASGHKATFQAQEEEKRLQRSLYLKELTKSVTSLEEFELEVAKQLGGANDADSAELYLRNKHGLTSRDPREYLSPRFEHNHLRDLEFSKDHVVELKPSHTMDTSRFFAIIVGIDMYGSYPLRGCVSDARLMEKYLTEVLRVPKNRIQLLLGSKEDTISENAATPSRANIISALLSLATNDEIKFGDNIIIYFAGHGSSYPPSEDNGSYGIIETLCPIDRDILDDNNTPIPDISDREFNTILSEIARVKGHRITVILDCCHSGGVLRSLPPPGTRTPAKMPNATLQDMLLAGEKNLKDRPGYRSILAKDWYPDMDSYVLLGACRGYQFAGEKRMNVENDKTRYNGIFTNALLRALQSGYCKDETTYVDLIRYLDKTFLQTPVVAGKRKGARIWFQE